MASKREGIDAADVLTRWVNRAREEANVATHVKVVKWSIVVPPPPVTVPTTASTTLSVFPSVRAIAVNGVTVPVADVIHTDVVLAPDCSRPDTLTAYAVGPVCDSGAPKVGPISSTMVGHARVQSTTAVQVSDTKHAPDSTEVRKTIQDGDDEDGESDKVEDSDPFKGVKIDLVVDGAGARLCWIDSSVTTHDANTVSFRVLRDSDLCEWTLFQQCRLPSCIEVNKRGVNLCTTKRSNDLETTKCLEQLVLTHMAVARMERQIQRGRLSPVLQSSATIANDDMKQIVSAVAVPAKVTGATPSGESAVAIASIAAGQSSTNKDRSVTDPTQQNISLHSLCPACSSPLQNNKCVRCPVKNQTGAPTATIWTCVVCTLENPMAQTHCVACTSPRDRTRLNGLLPVEIGQRRDAVVKNVIEIHSDRQRYDPDPYSMDDGDPYVGRRGRSRHGVLWADQQGLVYPRPSSRATVSVHVPKLEPWACHGCTFQNVREAVDCVMCEAPRPNDTPHVVARGEANKPPPSIPPPLNKVVTATTIPSVAVPIFAPVATVLTTTLTSAAAATIPVTMPVDLSSVNGSISTTSPSTATLTNTATVSTGSAVTLVQGGAVTSALVAPPSNSFSEVAKVTNAMWTCDACTFVNDKTLLRCDMCDAARPFTSYQRAALEERPHKRNTSRIDKPSSTASPVMKRIRERLSIGQHHRKCTTVGCCTRFPCRVCCVGEPEIEDGMAGDEDGDGDANDRDDDGRDASRFYSRSSRPLPELYDDDDDNENALLMLGHSKPSPVTMPAVSLVSATRTQAVAFVPPTPIVPILSDKTPVADASTSLPTVGAYVTLPPVDDVNTQLSTVVLPSTIGTSSTPLTTITSSSTSLPTVPPSNTPLPTVAPSNTPLPTFAVSRTLPLSEPLPTVAAPSPSPMVAAIEISSIPMTTVVPVVVITDPTTVPLQVKSEVKASFMGQNNSPICPPSGTASLNPCVQPFAECWLYATGDRVTVGSQTFIARQTTFGVSPPHADVWTLL